MNNNFFWLFFTFLFSGNMSWVAQRADMRSMPPLFKSQSNRTARAPWSHLCSAWYPLQILPSSPASHHFPFTSSSQILAASSPHHITHKLLGSVLPTFHFLAWSFPDINIYEITYELISSSPATPYAPLSLRSSLFPDLPVDQVQKAGFEKIFRITGHSVDIFFCKRRFMCHKQLPSFKVATTSHRSLLD